MKKRFAMLIVGGIVAVSAMGLGFNSQIAGAAEKEVVHPGMHGDMVMQGEHKMDNMSPDANAMDTMMKNPDMHKQCMEMMKNPEMQSKMQEMMKNPEMQAQMQEQMKNSDMQCPMKETMQENK